MSETATTLWTAWTATRDARAFEALVGPELPHALGFARRLGCSPSDAEDAVQDALARLAVVRDAEPITTGLRAWLCRQVHVRARSRLRSDRRRRSRQARVAVAEACEPRVSQLAVREDVERSLAELGDAEREAVTLRYLHDLEYRDVALVLGISEGACRQRVHRGIERLRARLGRSAPALVAALPLPAASDVGLVVRAAIASKGWTSGLWAGGLLMATVTGKVALATVVLAAIVTGTYLLARARPDAISTSRAVEEAAARDASTRAPGGASGVAASPERGSANGRPEVLSGRRIARVGQGGLVGRVLDVRTTQGVASAVVSLTGRGLGGEVVDVRTETGSDGSFRFASAPAGFDFVLRAVAPGLVALEQRGVVVKADDVADLGRLWLGVAGRLEGSVVDPDGHAVRGAEVRLHRSLGSLGELLQTGGYTELFVQLDREPEPIARTTTGDGGTFRFDETAGGPLSLVVRAPGWRLAVVQVTLTAEAVHAPVHVRLAPGATLAGRVVDAGGEGLAGVRVTAFSEDGGMPSTLGRALAISAADGAFRLDSLSGEGRLRVVGAASGYPDAFLHANAGDTDVRVVMRRGATVDVRVVSEVSGAPLAGAQVLLAVGDRFHLDDGPGALVGGLTDDSGTAVLEVFPGELQLAIVDAPGVPPNYWDAAGRSAAMGHGLKGPTDVRVPAGRSTVTFRVPPGVRLTGRVMDMEGSPLAGADVTCFGFLGVGGRAVSGEDGSYELEVVGGEVSMGVRARLPGWVQDEVGLPRSDGGDPRIGAADGRNFDVRMRRIASVAGRVVDPSGRPVAGASVTVRRVRTDDRFVFDPTTQRLGRLLGGHPGTLTRADGTYLVEGVPSEVEVRVFAGSEGLIDGATEVFTVGSGRTRAPDLRLIAGATLAVQVIDALGAGVAGALVRVDVERADDVRGNDWESTREREADSAAHRTRATGTLELTRLPPGTVTLRVTAEGFAPGGAVVALSPGGNAQEAITVRLKPGRTVSGRVVDGDGRPLEGVLICIATTQRSGETSASGSVGAAADGDAADEPDWIPDWDRSRRATTDAYGRWTVRDLPRKPCSAHASKDGYGGAALALGDTDAPVELRLVQLEADAATRIVEIDRALQALYGRMSVEGETPPILEQLWALREERQRLQSPTK